jgi:autotransporter-associated beta strand protein
MDARAAYIWHKIRNKLYTASLVKQGPGTLVMTGHNTYEGGATVKGGKLSITGSHASSIDVQGGTLGGSGLVAGSIDVKSGVLQPGFSQEEATQAASITQVAIAPGNVLSSEGTVRIRDRGRLLITIRGNNDYTSVSTTGQVFLDGDLDLDVQGQLSKGAVLTILNGSRIVGKFDRSKKGHELRAGGYEFKISYRSTHVTLTASKPRHHGHDDDDDDDDDDDGGHHHGHGGHHHGHGKSGGRH